MEFSIIFKTRRFAPVGLLHYNAQPSMNPSFVRWAWIAALLCLFLCSPLCRAQQATADLVGTVTDASGGVVPGASVTVTNMGTGEVRTSVTSGAGDFSVNLLNPGRYSVVVSFQGFQKYEVPSINLAAGDRFRANATLSVGQSSETVTVESTTPALRTDSSDLATTITEKSVQDLPLNGRNIYQLAQLAPGASQPVAQGGFNNGSGYDDRRPTTSISVNGQSDIQNNNLVDGVDNNERLVGSIGVRPAVDATSELRVATSNYTADTGRTAGGVIDIITKAGTNAMHGTLYEFFRNDIFDAYPFAFGAKLPKSELRQNQYGGSLGGPIVKGNTFFFVDYEGFRFISGSNPSTAQAPTQSELNDPTTEPGLPAGTSAAALDPAGLAYFALLPAANTTLADGVTPAYSGAGRRTNYSHTGDLRIDHKFNANDTMFARFSYNNVYAFNSGAWGDRTSHGLTLDPGSLDSLDIAYSGHLNFTHVFNPQTMLELKALYTRVDNKTYPAGQGQNPNAAFGQPNVNTGTQSALAFAALVDGSWSLGNTAFLPDLVADNTFVYQGSVVRSQGAHSFKLGGGIIRRQLTNYQSPYGEGLFVFTNYASLLQGLYLETFRELSLATPHLRTWEPSGYLQDDWRASSDLTVNLGLRYDLFTPYTETRNQLSTFDPNTQNIVVAGQNGISDTAGIQTDYSNLSPRLGFAATLSKGLVVRGAFGLTFFPGNQTSGSTIRNAPFTSTLATCSVQFPYTLFLGQCPGLTRFADGLPVPAADDPTKPTQINAAVSRHFRSTYLDQFNLGVEKELGGNILAVNYVGSLGKHLAQNISDLNSPNQCASIGGPPCTSPRPFATSQPQLGSVQYLQSEGESSYNAVQFTFERRLKQGLSVSANYVLGHSLDDASGVASNRAVGYGFNPSKINQTDYANSDLDVRNHVALTGNYELPFGNGANTFGRYLEKGWQINSIYVWSSGAPFAVVNSTSISGTSPTVGSGTGDRPDKVASASVTNQSIGQWFNTSAFVAQTPDTLGNEARNSLRGPRFSRLDFSLFRTFDLTERYKLEFRTESFNLANHANFSLPNVVIGASNSGQITATSAVYTPRQLQFALKLTF